jgi:hypothetical protein
MTDSGQASAAPIPVTLGGKQYQLSPFRDRDGAEWLRYVRGRIFDIADENAKRLSPTTADMIMGHATRVAMRITALSPEAAAIAATPEGFAMVVWLRLHQNHKDLTVEQVQELLREPGAVDGVMVKIDLLNKLEAGEDAGKKNTETEESQT